MAINLHQYAFRLQSLLFHARIICGGKIFSFPIRSQIVELVFICFDFQTTWKCLWSNNPGGYFQWKPLIDQPGVYFNETDQPSMLPSSRVTLVGRFIEVSHADGDVDQYSHQCFQAVCHFIRSVDPGKLRWLLMKMKMSKLPCDTWLLLRFWYQPDKPLVG